MKALFVGGNAFAKGIVPMVRAIERLRKMGADVRLTIVSSFKGSNYVLRHTTPDVQQWMQHIASKPWITYHPSMPNAQVLQQMSSHDVLLFPSLDETLGWVVIEAGLVGLPAIVTNVFALPELVADGKTGYVIPIEVNGDCRWPGLWLGGRQLEDAVDRAYKQIEDGLVGAWERLGQDGTRVDALGEAARRRMREWYDPEDAAQMLQGIYETAISDQPLNQRELPESLRAPKSLVCSE